MTKKLILLIGAALLTVALVLYIFFARGRADHPVVPDDAPAVAVIHPQELLSSLQTTEEDLLHLFQIKESRGAGLNLQRPVYAFLSKDDKIGLSATLSDKQDLESFLSGYDIALTSENGYQWAQYKNMLLTFDARRVLAAGPVSKDEVATLRRQMCQWMESSSRKNPLLTQAEEEQGIVGISTYAHAALLHCLGLSVGSLPFALDDEDLQLTGALSAHDNTAQLALSLKAHNPALQEILEALGQVALPIATETTALAPDEPFLSARLNLNGEHLLNLLRRHPALRTALVALNLAIDADKMIRSISGDVQIVLPTYITAPSDWLLTAALTDTRFLDDAPSWQHGIMSSLFNFRALSDTDFTLTTDNKTYHLGVRNKRLYLTPSPLLAAIACLETSSPAQPIPADTRLFATADIHSLLAHLRPETSSRPIPNTARLTLMLSEGTSTPIMQNAKRKMQKNDGPATEGHQLQLQLIFQTDRPIAQWLQHLIQP